MDNYCHGLIIAERALKKGSAALGKFYIVTDGKTHPNVNQYLILWKILDEAIKGMVLKLISSNMHLPKELIFFLA